MYRISCFHLKKPEIFGQKSNGLVKTITKYNNVNKVQIIIAIVLFIFIKNKIYFIKQKS